jgi:hypothetical protein
MSFFARDLINHMGMKGGLGKEGKRGYARPLAAHCVSHQGMEED